MTDGTQAAWQQKLQDTLARAFAIFADDEEDARPRQRYTRTLANGWLYSYTTTPLPDGTFAAAAYKPTGPGARSGRAVHWALSREVHFRTRKAAKARCLKWYETAKAKESPACSPTCR